MENPYERRLRRVVEHIYDNLDGDLSLDALAEVAAMSRFHWHRIWHGMMGETLAQTARRIRLHRAAMMLVHEPAGLAEIAARCGYPSQASFTRAFRDAYGITPGAFREAGRDVPPLRSGLARSETMYDVTVTEEQPRRVAGVTHTGPYTEISEAFEKMGATIVGRGQMSQAREMIGVYWQDPRATPPEELRSFAGVSVGEEFQIAPPLEELRLDGGTYAVLRFHGPYTGLQSAYDYLFGPWLAEGGRTLRDAPCFELYKNTPAEVPPSELLTLIFMPVSGAA